MRSRLRFPKDELDRYAGRVVRGGWEAIWAEPRERALAEAWEGPGGGPAAGEAAGEAGPAKEDLRRDLQGELIR